MGIVPDVQNLMTRFEEMHRAQKERKARRGSNGGTPNAADSAGGSATNHDFVRSIHRCLIYLGDLAR